MASVQQGMIDCNNREGENVRPNAREGLDSGPLGRDTTGVQMLVASLTSQPPDCYSSCPRPDAELRTIQTEKSIKISTRALILFYED